MARVPSWFDDGWFSFTEEIREIRDLVRRDRCMIGIAFIIFVSGRYAMKVQG